MAEPGADGFSVFAFSPPRVLDADLAIAASRAGAVGVLNAEYVPQAADAAAALARLAGHASAPFGCRLGDATPDWLALWQPYARDDNVAIVDSHALRRNPEAFARLRGMGGRVVVEIAASADAADDLWSDADGLILKGHECGGWIGEETSFILLQKVRGQTGKPLYVRGGVTPESAAAMFVGGADGVVLDDQLLLLRESALAASLAPKLARFSGVETIYIDAGERGRHLRVWAPPGTNDARAFAASVQRDGGPDDRHAARLGWGADGQGALVPPLGQDGVFAPIWAERYGRIAFALRAIHRSVAELPALAARLNILQEGSPLAASHGARLPIVQGPMTHVSDRAAFAKAVADAGGLPMIAASLMRGKQLAPLLEETHALLGEAPWGVGLLGFLPPDVLDEQRAAILANKPRFAIIAGGRPDQAHELERAGIHTYLHVPSPALLEQFLEQGSRHFIFEGRECGGHIGPLSSFVLWSRMVDAILRSDIANPEQLHFLLAGGIHDAVSAAMASVIAARLAQAGIRVGVLMGTGYIFTEEAVASGAITAQFQQIVVDGSATAGLVTGPGHASRCVVTPFVTEFHARRRGLEAKGAAAEDIRESLESMTLGRLRLATKGLQRASADNRELVRRSDADQREGGMYMIGQAVALRTAPTTVAGLHHDVSAGSGAILARYAEQPAPREAVRPACDIAIIGISAFLPGAADARTYWKNILDKVDAITEIPADRWDWRPYYSEDRSARDRIYSKWGGFVPDIPFDPVEFGIPPNSVSAIDPMQLLALAAIRDVLQDAGLQKQDAAARERTSVILGFSGGLGERGVGLATRTELRRGAQIVDEDLLKALPEWTADSFAGLLPNVSAGRATNRFDFGGVNFSVDAACASSLSAIYQATLELESGRSDVVIAGGVDTVQGPFGFTCFAKAQAMSPSGRCRTFDSSADGIAISEGVAMLALKRLADAERDGDRIYAVIKGAGGSSDGKAKGLMAPSPKGQVRALRRAYDQAGFPCSTVGLVEAHGTGTLAGDRAELESLGTVLAGSAPRTVAVGSVKTMIGHTKSTAGAAGLAKVAMALHDKILPPHLGVTDPNPALRSDDSPLYVNGQTRPWLKPADHPRRAGVSSFGFGGTNFHVVLEEYTREFRDTAVLSRRLDWPAELFVWRAATREDLAKAVRQTRGALDAAQALPDLAHALAEAAPANGLGAAVVAGSPAELRTRLDLLLQRLDGGPAAPAPGVYFEAKPLGGDGSLAILFSGQGSQYPDMLRELAATFAPLRQTVEDADRVLAATPTFANRRLARLIYPPDVFRPEDEAAAKAALTATEVAQPALGAVSAGLWRVLTRLGLRADMMCGHSYGEFTALHAAGALSFDDLLLVSEARGRFIARSAADGDLGTMAAVFADEDAVRPVVESIEGLVIANYNAPTQIVLSGTRDAVAEGLRRLEAAGLSGKAIPVAAAFHSWLMQPAQEPLADRMAACRWSEPAVAVYSNTLATRHGPADEIRSVMARHLLEPVRFTQMIESMYADGARIFLEVGPRSVLADLARASLKGRPGVAVAADGAGGGVAGFLAALAALFVHGVPMDLAALTRGRTAVAAVPKRNAPGPTTWLINGGQTKPPNVYPATGNDRPGTTVKSGTNVAPFSDRKGAAAVEPSKTARIIKASGAPPASQAGSARSALSDNADERMGRPMSNDYEEDTPPSLNGEYADTYEHADQQAAVMSSYFSLMRQFMHVQENVVMSYLGATPQPPAFGGAPDFLLPGAMDAGAGNQPAGRTQRRNVLNGQERVRHPAPAGTNGRSYAPPRQDHAPRAAEAQEPSRPAVNGNGADNGPAERAPAEPHVNGAEAGNGAPASVNVEAVLVGLVADRTGYPANMLSLEADIEADLGIDSIKRVEILGALRKSLPGGMAQALEGQMAALSKAKSLQAILAIVAQSTGGAAGDAGIPFAKAEKNGQKEAASYLGSS